MGDGDGSEAAPSSPPGDYGDHVPPGEDDLRAVGRDTAFGCFGFVLGSAGALAALALLLAT
ncbi:MAG: hypothetical protein QOH73_890 [Gaiellaceae bacterium]|jgi:hypothetical protein|nr:hypothetical protein [Gaiellaceae bacterium]